MKRVFLLMTVILLNSFQISAKNETEDEMKVWIYYDENTTATEVNSNPDVQQEEQEYDSLENEDDLSLRELPRRVNPDMAGKIAQSKACTGFWVSLYKWDTEDIDLETSCSKLGTSVKKLRNETCGNMTDGDRILIFYAIESCPEISQELELVLSHTMSAEFTKKRDKRLESQYDCMRHERSMAEKVIPDLLMTSVTSFLVLNFLNVNR